MMSNDNRFAHNRFIHDRLVLFGFGLFETLLITESGPQFVDLHWKRMKNGADVLSLNMPDEADWLQQIHAFLGQTSQSQPYALRVTLSGGAPENQLPAQLLFHKRPIPYTPLQYEKGILLHRLTTPRNEYSPLTQIKSTNYLENLLAKETAKRHGADEGMWCNTQGFLCEGSMSNLFFIKEGALYTPSLDSGCLPGTRRRLILDLARTLQIPTFEGLYWPAQLLEADEIFMTNALMGLMPVRQIDNTVFSVVPLNSTTTLMRRLQIEYLNMINRHNP